MQKEIHDSVKVIQLDTDQAMFGKDLNHVVRVIIL